MKTLAIGILSLAALLFCGTLSAQTNVQVCKGENICHTVNSHRGSIQWQQSPDGVNWTNITGATSDTLCMAADSNGHYRAAITEGSCAAIYSDEYFVEAIVVTVNAGADGLFCAGDSVALGGAPTVSSGVAPYTYQWLPPIGMTNIFDSNPMASPNSNTTYALLVTDAIGCNGTDSVTIGPAPLVIADAGPDQNICNGSSELLGGSPAGSGGAGPLNYAWSPATDLSATNVPNPVVTPTGPMTYHLTVTDSLGCSAMDTVVVDTLSGVANGTVTFSYTGAVQTFVVPGCVDSIVMDVYGAQGGANWVNNVNFGGRVTATLAVTTGETLYIYVGEQPTSGILPGWNGGGSGDGVGKGGGGASDVRQGGTTLNDRIIVGGAGGGAGYWSNLHVVGGPGGGLTGGNGYRQPDYASNPGGLGATQTAGGANGTCINLYVTTMAGSFGQGGTPLGYSCGCEGYGGGGGWYGGAGSGNCRGAGGGSSYTHPSATNVTHNQGVRAGNGQVIFTW